MGKGALVAAAFVLATTMTMLFNAQLKSQETEQREYKRQANFMARELAMEGRKAVLAEWVGKGGTLASWLGGPVFRDGGRILVSGLTQSGSVLDFTVQADYDSTVHQVRSRYSWQNFAVNPFQLKTWRVNPSISSLATLDFDSLALDDQNIQDLEDILVDDLGIIGSLGDVNIDWADLVNDVTLATSGHSVGITEITQAERDYYATQEGIFFPDQINQVVTEFSLANPSLLQTVDDFYSLGTDFGINDGLQMLTVEGDLNITSNFAGKGILVVEGDLVIPSGIDFEWDGIILVKPPSSNMNPVVDFSGNVNIEGMFVTLQEPINAGHMDLSVMRDMSGTWALPNGTDIQDQDVLKHTHDYTSKQGNYVVFHSDRAGAPNHQGYNKFDETLSQISSSDSIYLEIYNHTNHGLGLIQFDLIGQDAIFQSVPAGFDTTLADPGNKYRTQVFDPADLEHFDITITRLSSLRKLWDTGNPYLPECTYDSGPHCVWHTHSRMNALTIRLFSTDGVTSTRVYEASLYWHKRTDEEEEFNEDMADLVSGLQDPTNGLDLTIGDNTSIRSDLGAILNLGPFSGVSFGATHLGTWHRQWAPGETGNPLLVP